MDNEEQNKAAGHQDAEQLSRLKRPVPSAEELAGELDDWVLTPAQRKFIESLLQEDDRPDDHHD